MIFHAKNPAWWLLDVPFTGSDYIHKALKKKFDWPDVLDVTSKYWNSAPPKWLKAKKPKAVIVIRNPLSRAVALWSASKRDKNGAQKDASVGFEEWLKLAYNRKLLTNVPWPREFYQLNCLEQSIWFSSYKYWHYILKHEHLVNDFNGFLADTGQDSIDLKIKLSEDEKNWESFCTGKAVSLVRRLWPQDVVIFSNHYKLPLARK